MTVEINRLNPLGVAAAAVVAFRAVAGAPSLVPGADVVYDAVMVILSLVTTAGAIPAAVGNLALWLLYIGLFYRVVPEIIPDAFDAFSTDRGLVGIIAVSSVGFGAIAFAPIVEALMRLRDPRMAEPMGLEAQITILTAILLATTAVIGGYVTVWFGDPLNPASALYEFNAAVVGRSDPDRPERLAVRFREAGGWMETYGRASGYLTVGTVFAFACLGLGGFTVVLAGFSPLPELLLMTVVTYRYAPISAPVSLGADVEWNIQQSVRVVFRNTKERSAVVVFLFGLFIALGTVVLGISRLQAAAWRMRRSGGAIVMVTCRF